MSDVPHGAYEARISKMRERMQVRGIDTLFLMISSDLQYLTGVERPPHNPTDDNKHGDEIYGAFIGMDKGPVFVVPRMGGSAFLAAQAQDKPWIEDIVVVNEGVNSSTDDLQRVCHDMLHRFGIPKRLGVSGRLWAKSLMLFRRTDPLIKFADASAEIAKLRAIKDATETRIMKEAGEITDKVFSGVLKQMKPGMTEYDLVREVNHQVFMQGGSGVSFHTNVWVSGPEVKPQYLPDKKTRATPLTPGSVVCFDFGIVHRGYVSDFGRSVSVGEPLPDYKRNYDLIMAAQQLAISEMKPGITAAELNRVGRRLIEEAGMGPKFTHRLGHGIGIDVHEPPFLFEMDNTVLEEGMCFTIEPSIRDVVDVRVEDVVQVTQSGGVRFSNFDRGHLAI